MSVLLHSYAYVCNNTDICLVFLNGNISILLNVSKRVSIMNDDLPLKYMNLLPLRKTRQMSVLLHTYAYEFSVVSKEEIKILILIKSR
jgi:hypothetical protein